ncbi:hypothetical protein [Micromonospora echinofusca]|uniref:4-amino-4-deoxy-L-arabinose transferase n=1 Tax=Micromonospora echinofusca TaxID=47858 RepID=A0ABS3VRG8_MICEH|nr:hypothetical protein [Micromonospora echinofusca]MBO4207107.1 hypothetical protein [Micromonospora echinofusca]
MGTPPHNSDEATMGLAALHIGQGRELPVYFYGQHYMGTVEAYLAAPLVAAFGPSVYALRAPTVLLYAAFLALMFVLVRRLFSPGLAVLTVGLLALGSDRVVKNQLIAGGGYPETGPMVAGLLLLTYLLLVRPVRPWYAFTGWGLLLGLVAWNHWLPAPFLLGALIVLCTARILTARTASAALGGFLVGVLPLLVDNIRAGAADNSVAVFLSLNGAGTDAALWDRIVGGAWLGLPLGMGLCAPSRCAGWSLWWGPVVVVLLVVATVQSIRSIRRRAGTAAAPGAARHRLRLVLAGAGLLSLLSYVRSPAAADTPVESARYLSILALSLPAALWPLWRVARTRAANVPVDAPAGRRPFRAAVPAMLPIVALAATMLAATVSVVGRVPEYSALRDRQEHLLAALDDAGLTYVHGDYWTCNWITYLSGERTVCGVVDDRLGRGLNRYPAHWRPEAQARVAVIGSPLDAELARRSPGVVPQVVAGHHIYPGTGR